jgi:rubrerythrin
MANCVIAYNPCFSCNEKKCEICELDMHRKRVFQQSEGEWGFDGMSWTCSECGEYATKGIKTDFCPYCGAHMKGGAE